MTYDSASRTWLMLDADGRRLVRLVERGDRVRAANGPALTALGHRQLQGVAADPASGLVYVAAPDIDRAYALTRGGALRQTLDTTDVGLTSLRTLAFGATADPTDSAKTTALYTNDAGGTLTTGWQQITFAHVPTTPGSHLDVNLLRSTPAGANCQVVNDLSVTTS